MASYEKFAQIYDWALNELPYDAWLTYIKELFKAYSVSPTSLVDLGCGTGSMAIRFAKEGIDVIGIDLSEDMLAVAREKSKEANVDIMFLCQDMTELDLYGTVDVIVSMGDALNYIIEEEDLLRVLERINLFLEPGGLLIFDMNTIYKFKEVLGNKTYAESHEDYAYIWENYYYEDERVNEYEVNIFVQEEDGRFAKTTEVHYERGYEVAEIKALLKQAGLELLSVYHDGTMEPVNEQTERMYFVARECQKTPLG